MPLLQPLVAPLALVSRNEPMSPNPAKLLIFLLASVAISGAQSVASNIPKPGIKEVQVSYSSLKPTATIKIGGTADWVLVTENAVWVAGTRPYAILRIDPVTNKIVARIRIPGEACSGLASGFGSIWTRSVEENLLWFESMQEEIRSARHFPLHPQARKAGLLQVMTASGW